MNEMTKERCMELLNAAIDHVSVARSISSAIKELLNIGFTAEELVCSFNFDRDDVACAAEETTELVPPLTFRLYQSVKFNRPIDPDNDCVSPGGYELVMQDEDGTKKPVGFDFEYYEGSIDKNDPSIMHCMQKNPDYDCFEGLNEVTAHMLKNVTDVVEWFIYTGEPGEVEDPLIPVEVIDARFEIISDSTGQDIPIVRIPIGGAGGSRGFKIIPDSHFSGGDEKGQQD